MYFCCCTCCSNTLANDVHRALQKHKGLNFNSAEYFIKKQWCCCKCLHKVSIIKGKVLSWRQAAKLLHEARDQWRPVGNGGSTHPSVFQPSRIQIGFALITADSLYPSDLLSVIYASVVFFLLQEIFLKGEKEHFTHLYKQYSVYSAFSLCSTLQSGFTH